jgi:uncharacterized protein YigE (DUF2233 family)
MKTTHSVRVRAGVAVCDVHVVAFYVEQSTSASHDFRD